MNRAWHWFGDKFMVISPISSSPEETALSVLLDRALSSCCLTFQNVASTNGSEKRD